MRLVRVLYEGDVRYGLADDATITLISDEPFAHWETEDDIPLEAATLTAPVVPTKIVCVGLNYKGHAKEMGEKLPDEPILFLKPSTSINGPNADVHIPAGQDCIDYEGELAIVIGRRARNLSEEDARYAVLGYTCGNDVTVRPLQKKDVQWTRAKSFDGFCPLGPWVDTDTDPMDLGIETYLNGEKRQESRTSDMVFNPLMLVSFISRHMTLLPGDVVMTGTPSGIGPMKHGDEVDVRIEGIGSLVNRVV